MPPSSPGWAPPNRPMRCHSTRTKWSCAGTTPSTRPNGSKPLGWLHCVNHPRVRLRLGRTTIREDHRLEQKRVDTLLVADVIEAVYAADPPDNVVIVSGDEDLTPALDVAVAKGVRVHLVTVAVDGARQGVSQHLRLSATSELPIDISELAPFAQSRSRMFAQMAGLPPGMPARDADGGEGGCGHEDGGGMGGTAAERTPSSRCGSSRCCPGCRPTRPAGRKRSTPCRRSSRATWWSPSGALWTTGCRLGRFRAPTWPGGPTGVGGGQVPSRTCGRHRWR